MKEIRLRGRGGQGAVIAAEMLAYAFVLEGKYASSFASFGPERRGAPVSSFLRFDAKPIRDTHQIYNPDCLIILDPFEAKLPAVLEGLRGDGIVVANTSKQSLSISHENLKKVGLLDATAIALKEIRRPISNTCLMGAFAKVTGWVSLDSVISSLEMYFEGEVLERNANAARRGYESVKVTSLVAGE